MFYVRWVFPILLFMVFAHSAQSEEFTDSSGVFGFIARQAYPTCGPMIALHNTLTQKGPLKIMSRLDKKHAINVYIDKDLDWALVLVKADGTACLIQTGVNWPVEPTGEGV